LLRELQQLEAALEPEYAHYPTVICKLRKRLEDEEKVIAEMKVAL
jgi:hypothetical protein